MASGTPKQGSRADRYAFWNELESQVRELFNRQQPGKLIASITNEEWDVYDGLGDGRLTKPLHELFGSLAAQAASAVGRRNRPQRRDDLLDLLAETSPHFEPFSGACNRVEDGTRSGLFPDVILAFADWCAARKARALIDMETPPGGEAGSDTKDAAPNLVSQAEPDEIFRREHDVWVLRFNQQTVHIPHYKGLGYIAELLRRPYVPIEAAELAGPRLPSNGPVKTRSAVKHPSLLADPGIKMATPKIIKNMHGALDEMRAELAGLPRDLLSNQRRADLEKKISHVEKYLREVKNNRGESRKVAGPAQRARSAVTKAINEAIEKISKKLPDLADHLEKCIDTGSTLMYAPPNDLDWSF
jgi:hypothetical protein